MKLKLHHQQLIIRQFSGRDTDALLETFHQSRKRRYELYQYRHISIHHQPCTQNTPLSKDACITIQLSQSFDDHTQIDTQCAQVCYEDELLLVVHKPAGLLVHSDGVTTSHTLCGQVKAYYQSQGLSCPIRPLHRLDYETSGLVVFCKIPFFQPMLDAMLANKEITRLYDAFMTGRFPHPHQRVDQPIARDRHDARKMRISSSGKPAQTDFTRVQMYKDFTHVRCRLYTGRTHQIRVHAAFLQHPLLADSLYGTSHVQLKRLALHAGEMQILHPLLQKTITITCPMPQDMCTLIK